jgi:hypothetical protein
VVATPIIKKCDTTTVDKYDAIAEVRHALANNMLRAGVAQETQELIAA